MPGGRSLNDRLQRRLGALRQPARNVLGKLENWKTGKLEDWKTGRLEDWKTGGCHLAIFGIENLVYLARRFSRLAPVGTQLCRFVSASPEPKRIIAYDIVRYIDADLTFRMIAALKSHLELIAEACSASVDEVHDRYLGLL